MIEIYERYTPNELAHALGEIQFDDAGSVLSALIVAINMIGTLQAQVNDLENLTSNLRRYDGSDAISAHEARYRH